MRMKAIALVLLCVLLTACSAKPDGPTWQEQYDLGLRYLEEGNYEEAILAFTAAIEIDPKQAPAYVGLADAYIGVGDIDAALQALEDGIASTGSEILQSCIEELIGEENKNLSTSILYNAGGGIEFSSRNGYLEYNELSTDEQTIMQFYVEGLLAQDGDALLKLSKESAYANREMIFFTTWNNYKVSMDSRSQVDDSDYIFRNCTEIELRPDTGIGYYAWIEYADHKPERDSTGYWDETHAIDEGITIIECPCENYSWNGDYSDSEQWHLTLETIKQGQSDISHFYQERVSTGSVIDGLHDGTVVETVIDKDSDYTSKTIITHYYDNGILLKTEQSINGETYSYVPPSTDGVWTIYNNAQWHYTDKQLLLDRLYW